jgi:hypothetical protein
MRDQGSHLHRPGGTGARGPPACELAEFGHRGVLLILDQLAPSGMVTRGTGELGDEDALWVGSGTMILIDLNRIEPVYGNCKSISTSPRPGGRRRSSVVLPAQ